MPTLLSHTTTTTTMVAAPLDTTRSLRKRPASAGGAERSPDGYFTYDEALLHSWRLHDLSGISPDGVSNFIRRRSKTHVNVDPNRQDVQGDEGAAGPDHAHPWRRPSRHDSRSPCPALNTAANHGYLPRAGRGLSMWHIITALRACYNVSWVLAILFTVASFVLLRAAGVGRGWLWPRIDLEELATHDVLEHNGSLTRADVDDAEAQDSGDRAGTRSPSVSSSSSSSTAISAAASPTVTLRLPFPRSLLLISPLLSFVPLLSHFLESPSPVQPNPHTPTSPGSTHRRAPLRPSLTLIRALIADSASGTHFTLSDLARARLRRTATAGYTSPLLSQGADSELVLSIAVLGGDVHGSDPTVKLDVLREWLEEERLPAGWRPGGVLGVWQNHVNTAKMQEIMRRLKKYREARVDVRTVVVE